jgi:hypothetical protein
MSISTLYKYKSLSITSITEELKHARSIICDSEIYFSSPFDFNDPFECHPVFILGATIERKEKYCRDTLKLDLPIMTMAEWTKLETKFRKDNFKESKDNGIGLCCFSELGDEILMYSHYASSHQGFCLKFEMPIESSLGLAREVEYSNKYPTINLAVHSEEEKLKLMFAYKSKNGNTKKSGE